VCDEPTAALDAQSGQTVMGLLKQVAVKADRTVIVVTHDSRVFQFGDRVLEMADGRIVLDSAAARDSQEFIRQEHAAP
jgi:putative ABC transport system ATP-binding protein